MTTPDITPKDITPKEIEALRPQWAEAERKMYPLATVSPEKYQQLVRLAREVADGLAHVTTSTELAARWSDATSLVTAAAERLSIPVGDLPPQHVGGVGFALRDAELREIAYRHEMTALIASARANGEEWALLHETGDLAHGLLAPYSAIELQLGTGAALVSSVEPNPVDGSANHVLTVIRMNSTTGEVIEIDPGIAETEEYSDAADFTAARASLRQRLSR